MRFFYMKKLILLLHVYIVALFCITPLYSMHWNAYASRKELPDPLSQTTENKNVRPLAPKQPEEPFDRIVENQILYETHASQAYAYNANRLLFSNVFFNVDILNQICIHYGPLLNDAIQGAMVLRITCKELNKILTCEKITEMCNQYDQTEKNIFLEDLKNIVKSMHPHNYTTKRIPALILLHANAKTTFTKTNYCEDELLQNAVLNDDEQTIQILLENGANPNAKSYLGQLFCYAGTVKIAEIFFNHGANIHATISSIKPEYFSYYPNVLWEILQKKYPSELMAFYLACGVDAKKRFGPVDEGFKGGNCLLHELANPISLHIDNIDDFLRKGQLLLATIPEMINTLNQDGQTPTDIAQESFENAGTYMYNGTPHAFESLIILFKEHGGLPAYKLGSTSKNTLFSPKSVRIKFH